MEKKNMPNPTQCTDCCEKIIGITVVCFRCNKHLCSGCPQTCVVCIRSDICYQCLLFCDKCNKNFCFATCQSAHYCEECVDCQCSNDLIMCCHCRNFVCKDCGTECENCQQSTVCKDCFTNKKTKCRAKKESTPDSLLKTM